MIFTFSLLVKNPVAPAVKRAFPRARATRREADWRRQLVRAFLYMSEQSPDQAEELLADYERREREGPDSCASAPAASSPTQRAHAPDLEIPHAYAALVGGQGNRT